MDKNLIIKRISQIVGLLAILLTGVLAVLFYINLNNADSLNNYINMLFIFTLVVAGLAILFAFILGPIISMAANPKAITKALISIAVLVVVFLVAYGLSSPDTSKIMLQIKVKNLAQKALYTETGLISLYIMAGLAILAIIADGVKSIFKL